MSALGGLGSCCLGGYQVAGSGEPYGVWQWVTGEPWSFTDWAPQEPNDGVGYWSTGEDRLMGHPNWPNQWNDVYQDEVTVPRGYIVEWEGATPPTASDQAITVVADTPKAFTLNASDPDNDPLAVTLVTPPAHGTVTGTVPNMTYTPAAGNVGHDSFTYQVSDGFPPEVSATVQVAVIPKAPTITMVAGSATQPMYYSVGSWRSQSDDPLAPWGSTPVHFIGWAWSGGSQETIGGGKYLVYRYKLEFPRAVRINAVTASGAAFLSMRARLLDADGAIVSSLDYDDGNSGGQYSLSGNNATGTTFYFEEWDNCMYWRYRASLAVSYTVINEPPVANPQTVSAVSGVAKPITLSGSDGDGDPLTFSTVTDPTNGNVTGTAPSVTYTSAATFHGTDTFTFKVNDGYDDSAPATVTVNVDAPVPVALNLSPSSAGPGSDVELAVRGTGFCSDSVVRWNGTDLARVSVTAKLIRATVPAAFLATPGGATVTVYTPGPGGGESNGLIFRIGQPAIKVDALTVSKNGTLSARITLKNTGAGIAQNVRITLAKMQKLPGGPVVTTSTSLPVVVGNLNPGATIVVTPDLQWPGTVANVGDTVLVQLGGTFTGGAFSSSRKATVVGGKAGRK